MEVNVDEMVIKSNSKEEMLADIRETLKRLRVINLKLNLKKCSFGVEEGRFSGHLITKQGIKEDPSKVKAISDLQPSNSIKADEAFRRMKELLEALPTVTAPVNGEALIVYLASSKESISAILRAERGRKQVPMYFVSRTLHGAELEYLELEKLILALVYAARKLRRYFQAYLIQVLSDKPIKQIITRPENLGHIAKWVIELGEHEIEFRRRNSIKGKILADFLAETPSKKDKEIKNRESKRKELEPESAWKLFTDGASTSDGSIVGLMLVDPKGKEYTYALRFEFETTNNEAEYKALLTGLRIAKEMKIQELIIFVDSQLVANQVNRHFEARQPVIKQYLEKAKELLVSFYTYPIEHIKRDQNNKADAHSKLASMTFSKLAKEVLVEVLQEKIITQKEVTNATQEEEANGQNTIPKIILVTMVKVRRSSTCQGHHPRSTPRIMWNALGIMIDSIKDHKCDNRGLSRLVKP
ncbi:reverse transcriptase domain-containing protein [Tanacetum coccineum]